MGIFKVVWPFMAGDIVKEKSEGTAVPPTTVLVIVKDGASNIALPGRGIVCAPVLEYCPELAGASNAV
jgi:hypothetical protein